MEQQDQPTTSLARKTQLLKRIAEDKKRLAAIESREKNHERKIRTRRLIETGALTEKYLGEDREFIDFTLRVINLEKLREMFAQRKQQQHPIASDQSSSGNPG